MGNCHCWQPNLNEPTLKTLTANPDEFNIEALSPRLAILADLAINGKTETVNQIDLTNRELGKEGELSLPNLFQYFTHISSLLLGSIKLDLNTWELITETLLNFSKLIELNLSHNYIGTKGIEKLGLSLERMLKLEKLMLESTQLESTGMILLCTGLVNLRNLKVLVLADNKIGDIGIKTLSNVIENLLNLVYFDIHRNEISKIGSVYIGKCLEFLKDLQIFKVGSNFLM